MSTVIPSLVPALKIHHNGDRYFEEVFGFEELYAGEWKNYSLEISQDSVEYLD